MAPKDGADLEMRACTDSEPDSVELLDLDSDSGSQSGWQAPLSYCDACDACIGPDEASVEVGGRRWHPSCLTCWVCGLPPDQRCFVTRLGHVLCIDDFNRLYNSCRRCGRQFCSPWELAVVAPTVPPRRYHPACFSCGLCRRTMVRHELFAVGTDDVFCPAHAPAGGAGPAVPLPGPAGQLGGLGSLGQPAYSVAPGRPGRGRRRGARKTGARLPAELSESRRKRHRIQFSAQQLRELQTSFGGNPNPDSKSIFDLAGRLGLGKQHVQVWFQNRRAKERRLKSESPQSES